MDTYIVLAAAIVLFTGAYFLMKQVGPAIINREYRKEDMKQHYHGTVYVGYDMPTKRSEFQAAIKEFRKNHPNVIVRLVWASPKKLLHGLENGKLDFLCLSFDGLQKMTQSSSAVKVSFSSGKMVTTIENRCIASEMFSQFFYAIWDTASISPAAKHLLSFLYYDNVTLHTGYCDYKEGDDQYEAISTEPATSALSTIVSVPETEEN